MDPYLCTMNCIPNSIKLCYEETEVAVVHPRVETTDDNDIPTRESKTKTYGYAINLIRSKTLVHSAAGRKHMYTRAGFSKRIQATWIEQFRDVKVTTEQSKQRKMGTSTFLQVMGIDISLCDKGFKSDHLIIFILLWFNLILTTVDNGAIYYIQAKCWPKFHNKPLSSGFLLKVLKALHKSSRRV